MRIQAVRLPQMSRFGVLPPEQDAERMLSNALAESVQWKLAGTPGMSYRCNPGGGKRELSLTAYQIGPEPGTGRISFGQPPTRKNGKTSPGLLIEIQNDQVTTILYQRQRVDGRLRRGVHDVEQDVDTRNIRQLAQQLYVLVKSWGGLKVPEGPRVKVLKRLALDVRRQRQIGPMALQQRSRG